MPSKPHLMKPSPGFAMPDTHPAREWTAVGLAMVYPSLLTLAYFVLLAEQPGFWQQTTYTIGKTLQFAFPLVWIVVLCRESIRWQKPTSRGLGWACAFGGVTVLLMLLLYHLGLKPWGLFDEAADEVRQRIDQFAVTTVAQYALLGLFYSLVHSGLEEYYWRWFVFGRLRRLISIRTAIVVSALAFTAHHVIVLATFFGWTSPVGWLLSLAVFVGGLFWAWLYQRSGSLYGPWLSHLLIDAGIFWIGYDLWTTAA